MTNDKLDICPKCECDACYIKPISEFANSYFCWGCGFNTTDLMLEEQFDFAEFEINVPELYKQLATTDSVGRRWYPSFINIPDVGTVFINGTSIENWQWAGILLRPLTEKEQLMYVERGIKNIPKMLSDVKSLQMFGKDFIDACEYVGVFKEI